MSASKMVFASGAFRGLRGLLVISALSLGLAACGKLADVTGSIGGTNAPLPQGRDALSSYADEWGRRFEAHPGDKASALNYARALRALERHAQAVAVLQGALIRNPTDMDVIGAYGKSLADAGRLQEAAETLARAHTPERPNWSILSAQGSVADQLGDHKQAQDFYQTALKIRPNEPSVLSNLGLSYALDKQLPLAEQALRGASDARGADMRVRQNLALVLALRGKFDEAETLLRRDLSPEDARGNVASIRDMIAQSNTWREIQKHDSARSANVAPAKVSGQRAQVAPEAPPAPL